MTKPMKFENEQAIGRVSMVETMRVFIDVDNHDLLKTIMVGNLISVQGATGNQYLISIVERVSRLPIESGLLEDENEGSVDSTPQMKDTIRCTLVGTYWNKFGDYGPRFKRGADSNPQIDQLCFVIHDENLSAFMNVLSLDIDESKALVLGHFALNPDAAAIADGDRFFQRHAAILGSTGSGKSYTVASILEKASKLDNPNIILLDMHGEYSSLAKEEPNGYCEYFRIAGPGDLAAPKENVIFLPYWLLNREEMLSMILDRSDDNAPNQASRFTAIVLEKKREKLSGGQFDSLRSTFTVDSPIPYDLGELVSQLEADDQDRGINPATGKEKNGPWNGKLTRFISRLDAKKNDRRYGFLFTPPTAYNAMEWLEEFAVTFMTTTIDGRSGIKIVDFSEVPSDVLPTVVSVFARLLYDIQFWMTPSARTPVCLACDEAHLYLPVRADADAAEKRALETFERIAKEGRKYGFSLLVVSQRPSDVSKTILSQCNNFISLRLTNDQDQAAVKAVMPDSMAGIAEILPLLDVGEAIILGDAILLPSRIKLAEPTAKPKSLTKRFWKEWTEKPSDSDAIRAAVRALRKQSRESI